MAMALLFAQLLMAVAMATHGETLDSRRIHFPNIPLREEDESGSASLSSPIQPKAIFILGDSSVDCGENTLLNSILHHNLSLFSCSGSDSDLVPYLLAAKMGITTVPSFYSLNGSVQSLINGVNFGSTQGNILLDPPNPSFQSLNQQLRQVFETLQLLSLHLSPSIATNHIQSSIFYLSFGKEDFIRFFNHEYNSTLPSSLKHKPRVFLHVLADQLVRSIRYLYDGDARKIVVMGVLPLGCAPGTVLKWHSMTGIRNETRGCIEWINQLVVEFNKVIEQHVLELKVELRDAHVVFCDAYEGIMEIIAKPSLYGFQNTRSGCCGRGWHHATSGCTSLDMACNKPSSHVWWDLYNPTRAVNSLLADSAWSGKPFAHMCHPMTVQDLMYA
ncbi:hypothetical protein V2J09_021929 [Rumex salicifolius]